MTKDKNLKDVKYLADQVRAILPHVPKATQSELLGYFAIAIAIGLPDKKGLRLAVRFLSHLGGVDAIEKAIQQLRDDLRRN
jgi:hypothetical protein